jgi:hypothetical protein
MTEDGGYLELSRREVLTGLFGLSTGALINDQVNNATETLRSQTVYIDSPDGLEVDDKEDLIENFSEKIELGSSEYVFTPSKSLPRRKMVVEPREDGLVDDDGIGSYDSGDVASFDVYEAEDIQRFLSGKDEDLEPMYESPLIGEGESAKFGGLYDNKIRVELLEADTDGATYHVSREV